MIELLLDRPDFEQDIRELLMAFFPGREYSHSPLTDAEHRAGLFWEEDDARLVFDGCEKRIASLPSSHTERKNIIKRAFYGILSEATGKLLPWGALTGIRPVKLALGMLAAGKTEEETEAAFRTEYLASAEKSRLAAQIALRERELSKGFDKADGYSLYVGIPFCPTTCLYCSFTSFPISKWQDRVCEYLAALGKELSFVAEQMHGRSPDTIYVGGGTPTSLDEKNLEGLMRLLETTFDMERVREYTVEAGRPDSITEGKLKVLKDHGVGRISINPQTMQQKTLELIGRRHTVEDVKKAFFMARDLGFDNINMDIICGLPGETERDLEDTLSQIEAMAPDSLTVHSLAIKRAARLNIQREEYRDKEIINNTLMMDMAAQSAGRLSLVPYYLYRQKNMAGNLENVGYSTMEKACVYNILMMEELQTVIGCGAGCSSKRVFAAENRVERCETVKDVAQYIARTEEMIERKHRLLG